MDTTTFHRLTITNRDGSRFVQDCPSRAEALAIATDRLADVHRLVLNEVTIAPREVREDLVATAVENLDELGVPVDVSGREAGRRLREAGYGATDAAVRAAVRLRREDSAEV